MRIPLIVVSAVVAYWLAKRAIPRIVSAAIVKGSTGQSPDEVAKRAETLAHVIVKTVAVMTAVLALLMVMAELGLDITALLASAGVVGIAVGFRAQSLVKDIVNGLFILLENQFGKGDVVSAAGVAGLVEDVNLRRTVLGAFSAGWLVRSSDLATYSLRDRSVAYTSAKQLSCFPQLATEFGVVTPEIQMPCPIQGRRPAEIELCSRCNNCGSRRLR